MSANEMAVDIASNLASKTLQPSQSHAFVTFNNQDSVLMSFYVPLYERLCLLHDNRIFGFKKTQANHDDASSSNEQNLLLNLLTTPKYRAMSAMYIIFRLLDNISLLLIIVLSIMKGQLTTPTPAQVALLSVIGLEVFYDVMLYTHKYWLLQRLSLYIGFVLYGAYYGIVAAKILRGEYSPDDQRIVLTILTIRFIAFILEESVDIAIDGELHNDLLKLQKYKIKQNNNENVSAENTKPIEQNNELILVIDQNDDEKQALLGKQSLKQWFKDYMDVRTAVEMPQDVRYVGSFFAWSAFSVFNENVWTEDRFPRWRVYLLCFIPFIVAFFLSLLVILLCIVAVIIPVLLAFPFAVICLGTCNCNKIREKVILCNFWKELTHF